MPSYITGSQSDERRQITSRFHDRLVETAAKRGNAWDLVDGPDGPEPAWAARERTVMLGMVNAERAGRHLPPVAEAVVAEWERQAAGHSDYARQWSFSCAQLAMGQEPRRA